MLCYNKFTGSRLLITGKPESEIEQEQYVSLFNFGNAKKINDKFVSYRILSKLKESKWGANRLERNRISANFQGNPLWPYKVLNHLEFLTSHFGLFDEVSSEFCLIPTVRKLNKDLENLFDQQEEIFKFYPLEKDQNIDEKNYIDLFIDQKMLPIAHESERDSVHDWSYHFITFLFQDYLNLLRSIFKKIRENIPPSLIIENYSWNFYGHTLDCNGKMIGISKQKSMTLKEAIYKQMAVSLDVATAKPVQILLLNKNTQNVQLISNELNSLKIFFKGLTEEAFNKVIWIESIRKQINQYNPSLFKSNSSTSTIESEPLTYFNETLQNLNCKLSKIHNETNFKNM